MMIIRHGISFHASCLMLTALVLAGASGHVHAQSVEQLRQLLKERDAEIINLRKRLSEALESKTSPQAAPPAAAPSARTGGGNVSTPTTVAAAGKFAVDDDEINRALERALVQRGDLLLPQGRYEVQPGLSYSRADGRSGFPRSDTLDASLSLRAGLPWQSQLQVNIPYSLRSRIGGEHADGFGDVSLAASTQLLQERGNMPSLVGSLGWTAPTGRDSFSGGLPLGPGFHTYSAGLTALKRLDPLVVTAGVSYSASRAEQILGLQVKPGAVTGLRLGGGLAISPDTSFDLGLNLNFVEQTRIDGRSVPGSDDVVGTLDIGFGIVLSRRMFLHAGGQFRLTGSAPDLALNISLPIRF